jgi:hypothetical protein
MDNIEQETISAAEPVSTPSPQLLVDSWYRLFEWRSMELRRVLYIAIEHDPELLRGIQVLVGEFPHHRALSRWLLRNEDQPFFTVDGKSLRFVRDGQGWQLRPADSLMAGSS